MEYDITLINPPQTQLLQPKAYIPLGLASIAAVLEESGISVNIMNLSDCDDLESVDYGNSKWYGISCVSATYNEAKQLVSILKDVGKTIVGGVHPSVLPVKTSRDMKPDVVMTGESEFMLRDLLLGDIPEQRIMKGGLIQDLDTLPFPSRHLFPRDEVIDYSGIHGQEKGVPATSIITSRGCPYSCNFCTKGHPMFNWYRYRSPENVDNELVSLKLEYGVEHIRFVDDEFTLHEKRTLELMDKIEDLDLTWVCITRADTLNERLVKKMKGAGCTEIHIGVETGSDRLLQLMNKQTTSKILLKGVKMIKKAGIRVKTYLMMNYPGETVEDRRKTVDWVKKAKPDKFTLSSFTPLPGSAVYSKQWKRKDWFYPDNDKRFLAYREELREASR